METDLRMHDVVALLEDTPARHFTTGQPLMLRRGQIGTVVMTYNGAAEVEFAGPDGRPYAMLPIQTARLLVLHDRPQHAAA